MAELDPQTDGDISQHSSEPSFLPHAADGQGRRVRLSGPSGPQHPRDMSGTGDFTEIRLLGQGVSGRASLVRRSRDAWFESMDSHE